MTGAGMGFGMGGRGKGGFHCALFLMPGEFSSCFIQHMPSFTLLSNISIGHEVRCCSGLSTSPTLGLLSSVAPIDMHLLSKGSCYLGISKAKGFFFQL